MCFVGLSFFFIIIVTNEKSFTIEIIRFRKVFEKVFDTFSGFTFSTNFFSSFVLYNFNEKFFLSLSSSLKLEAPNRNSRRCELSNIENHRASFAKHSRSDKHAESLKIFHQKILLNQMKSNQIYTTLNL